MCCGIAHFILNRTYKRMTQVNEKPNITSSCNNYNHSMNEAELPIVDVFFSIRYRYRALHIVIMTLEFREEGKKHTHTHTIKIITTPLK